MSTTTLARPSAPERAVADQRRRASRRLRTRRAALHLATFAVLLGTWWAVTRAGLVRPLFLPSPGAVWDAFVRANSDHPVSAGSSRLVRCVRAGTHELERAS